MCPDQSFHRDERSLEGVGSTLSAPYDGVKAM